jgi:PPOX class probable F420-dependent enzyme
MNASYFAGLTGYECVCLTTFRKNGEAVPTPVWFAESDGKLYIYTANSSGKVKRIRNNASVSAM